MKKVVENNSDKSCDNSDLSSSDISGNESDTGLTKNKKKVTTEELRKVFEKNLLSSDDEKPTKNKKKDTTTEEIKSFIENSLFSSDDEKPIKNTLTKKRKRLLKKSDDKDHKKTTKPIKIKKKVTTKDSPKKTLVEGDDFKKLQKKAKKRGAKYLDYSKRKNNKYVVGYKGKKIHFGSTKYEDYLIHKDLDRREKYLARAKKITNKNSDYTYNSPSFPNYWSVKLLN